MQNFFMIVWIVILFSFIMRIKINDRFVSIINVPSPLILGVYIIHPILNTVISLFLHINIPLLAVIYFVLIILM